MNDYVQTRDGGYWLAGKRISLDSVVYAFHRGQSPESIQQSFPLLTLEEIYGAIAFYLANREAVDQSIRQDEVAFEKFDRESKERNAAIYERIARARAELAIRR